MGKGPSFCISWRVLYMHILKMFTNQGLEAPINVAQKGSLTLTRLSPSHA